MQAGFVVCEYRYIRLLPLGDWYRHWPRWCTGTDTIPIREVFEVSGFLSIVDVTPDMPSALAKVRA